MKVAPETTISELIKQFPNGFTNRPGTQETPGALNLIVFASSYIETIARRGPTAIGNYIPLTLTPND